MHLVFQPSAWPRAKMHAFLAPNRNPKPQSQKPCSALRPWALGLVVQTHGWAKTLRGGTSLPYSALLTKRIIPTLRFFFTGYVVCVSTDKDLRAMAHIPLDKK